MGATHTWEAGGGEQRTAASPFAAGALEALTAAPAAAPFVAILAAVLRRVSICAMVAAWVAGERGG